MSRKNHFPFWIRRFFLLPPRHGYSTPHRTIYFIYLLHHFTLIRLFLIIFTQIILKVKSKQEALSSNRSDISSTTSKLIESYIKKTEFRNSGSHGKSGSTQSIHISDCSRIWSLLNTDQMVFLTVVSGNLSFHCALLDKSKKLPLDFFLNKGGESHLVFPTK